MIVKAAVIEEFTLKKSYHVVLSQAKDLLPHSKMQMPPK
jgi:hypothetical protein